MLTSHTVASAEHVPHPVSNLIAGGEWQAAGTALTLHWALQGHLLGKYVLLFAVHSTVRVAGIQKRDWRFQAWMRS